MEDTDQGFVAATILHSKPSVRKHLNPFFQCGTNNDIMSLESTWLQGFYMCNYLRLSSSTSTTFTYATFPLHCTTVAVKHPQLLASFI